MKKIFCLIILLLCNLYNSTFAKDIDLLEYNNIQSRVNKIGTDILNSNKLEKRVIFVYNDKAKSNILDSNKSITNREIIVFGNIYQQIETEDELAAYIAREIPAAIRSYEGFGAGWLSSLKMKAAPKKYELVFDKLAVDYMVKAGYNPLGLIVLINKTAPQARQDKISNKNLTSKRLAYIYERIYAKYPYYIVNNSYINNKYYQNFLLTSQKNREYAVKRIENPNNARVYKYE